MVSVVRKDTGNFIYMRLKKHNCPECGKQMKIVKMVKVVKSKTKEANGFNVPACDVAPGEKAKYIWYDFKCKDCGKNYTEEALRPIERKLKKQKKEEEKAAKKAAKLEKNK